MHDLQPNIIPASLPPTSAPNLLSPIRPELKHRLPHIPRFLVHILRFLVLGAMAAASNAAGEEA